MNTNTSPWRAASRPARASTTTNHMTSGTAQRFGRAPGYPLFLAALDAGRQRPESTPARVKVAQSIVGALTVWLIGVIAWRAAGARAGVWAAAIAAIYPPLVTLPAYTLSETVFSAVALASALVIQLSADRATQGRWRGAGLAAIGGALTGLGALIRPAMLLYLPLVGLWFLWRRRPVPAAILALAAIAVITPWTLRNLRVHERFVLIASEGGVTFWTGNHPLARGEGDLAANPALKEAELALRQAHPGLSPEALEPVYYREAIDWIAGHPLAWAELLARKLFYTVVPIGPSYAVHSARYRVASAGPYVLVLPFAIGGVRSALAQSAPSDVAVAARSFIGARGSGVFPPGAISDACHRSRNHHRCRRAGWPF